MVIVLDNSSLNKPSTNPTRPSLIFSATLPVNPSHTMTSASPLYTSRASTLPTKLSVLAFSNWCVTTGVLSAAFAAGAVLAGLFSGGLVRVVHQGRVIVAAIVAFGLAVAGFGAVLLLTGASQPPAVLWVPLVLAGLFLALAGGSDAVSSVFRQTILQSATPDDMRGRLQGIFIVVVAGGPRLGDLVLGTAATWTAESWAALGGGLLCAVLVVAAASAQRGFWAYDARHPQP